MWALPLPPRVQAVDDGRRTSRELTNVNPLGTSDQRLAGIRFAAGISRFAPLLECLLTPTWVGPTRVREVVTRQSFQ